MGNAPPRTFRIYLSTVPGDMEGERRMLAELVLPELRRQAAGAKREIVWLDPAAGPAREWDLATRLRAIESCDLFLGLLGGRYGDPPASLPRGLAAERPWLDRTWSVAEMEVQAALRSRARPFFYIRQSEPGREGRLVGLEEKLRSSGKPLFDGYPCRWNRESGRAEGLEVFAQRVFEDVWISLAEAPRRAEPPPAPPPAPPAAARRAPTGSWVTPGAVRPRRFPRGELITYLLLCAAAVLLLARGCLFSSPPARSTELIHLTRPPGAEALAAPASPDLPPPPANWRSWRDGVRACGLAFSDLERIARTARSAGQPAVEVLPAAGEKGPGLRQRLAAGGERAFIMPVSGYGKPACSVWIGPLGSATEAEEVARRVSTTYGVEARAGGFPDIDALGKSRPAP